MIDLQHESLDMVVRILVASILGGLIGLERDVRGRSAGLRTHILVAMGASMFMILSEKIAMAPDGSGMQFDRGRIAAQVVTGIGFLGAGVIIKSGTNVRGLTTAACLWTAAAIGMAAGGGYYLLAVFPTLIALLCLIALKYFEFFFYSKNVYRTLQVTTPIAFASADIIAIVNRKGLKVLDCDIKRNYDEGTTVTKLSMSLFHRGVTDGLAQEVLKSLEESKIVLKEVKWGPV